MATTTKVALKAKFVTTNGLKFHYLEWGKPGNPVVVLLHGARSTALCNEDVALALQDRYHVFSIDQRGRGMSSWAPDGNYSTEAYVDDLAGILDAWGLQNVVLWGHSMGARNALAFAGRFPQRVLGLILVDGGVSDGSLTIGSARIRNGLAGWPESFPSWDAARSWMAKQYAGHIPAATERRVATNLKEENGRIVWSFDPVLTGRGSPNSTQVPRPAGNSWEDVLKLRCPVLLAIGAQSEAISPAVVMRFQTAIPNAWTLSVPGSGHYVHEDNTAAIPFFRAFIDGLGRK